MREGSIALLLVAALWGTTGAFAADPPRKASTAQAPDAGRGATPPRATDAAGGVSSPRSADPARGVAVLRATDLRADKRPQAEVLRPLAPGDRVEVLGLEGGWARVRPAGAGQATGWVRAGVLDFAPQAVAALQSGRGSSTEGSVTLGIRGGPAPRWHALVVVAERAGRKLPGAAADLESALQLAGSLGVAEEDVTVLRGADASAAGIEAAVQAAAGRLGRADGLYVHVAGEGTLVSQGLRVPQGPGLAQGLGTCAEAVLAADARPVTGADWARWLAPVVTPARALLVVFDAGVAWPPRNVSVGLRTPADDGRLLPRFAATDRRCQAPKEVVALGDAAAGVLAGRDQALFAPAPRGQALADEAKGGLLTQYLRDCVLREARAGSVAPDANAARECVAERSAERVRGALAADAVQPALHGDAGMALQPLGTRSQLR